MSVKPQPLDVMADTKDQALTPMTNGHPAASDSSKTSDETPTDSSLKERQEPEPVEASGSGDLEATHDGDKKEEQMPKAKPRSTLEISLIMLSLCVNLLSSSYIIISTLKGLSDRGLPRCP